MNIEGLTLKLLTDTLNEELLGSKIYKVYMPNPQSLLLLVRRTRDTSSLLADMHNGSCVLYLPQQLPENPETPPTFCMLLRKHLEEGVYQVSAVSASDVLKRNTDSLRCAVENDVFASLPQDSLLDELEMGWEDEQ